MRSLRRPMFRYGGDVKAKGVMHGMKNMQDGGPATMADATGLANGGMPNMRGRVTGPGGYAGKKEGFLKRNYGKLMTGAGAAYNAPDILEMLRFFYKDGGVAGLPPMRGMVTGPGKYSQNAMKGFGGALKGDIEQRIKKNPAKAFKPGTYIAPTVKAGVRKYLPSLEGIGARGLGYLKNFYRKLEMPPKRISTGAPTGTNLSQAQIAAGMGTRPLSYLERINMFRKANPRTFYGGLGVGTTSGAIPYVAGKLAEGTGNLGLQIADLAVSDKYFDQDKVIGSSVKDIYGRVRKKLGFEDKKVPPPGSNENAPYGIKEPRQKTQAEIDAEIKANEDKKLKRIYSLLGVDRAQRGAASKALADMSRYIDEGGKDTISRKNIGSTLTKGILAFDKRLDKVDQLKEAAGLMMAKGEIEAMSNPLDKEYKKVMIDSKKREMNPTVLDQKLALDLKGQTLTHDRAATIAKRTFPNAVVLADAKKAKEEGIGDEKTVVEYVSEQIKTQGGSVAGVYVVDKSIVQVDAQGNIKQII